MSEIKDHFTVPAKPAAVTMANAAALAVAAIATGGVTAGALLAGGAAATVAVAKGRKEVRKAATRRSSTSSAGGMRKAAAAKRAASSGKGSSSKMGGSKKGSATPGAKVAGARGAMGKLLGGRKPAAVSGPKAAGSTGSPRKSSVFGRKSTSAGAGSASKSRKSPVTKAGKWAGKKVANGARRAVGLPVKPSSSPKKSRPGSKKVRDEFQKKIMGRGKKNPRAKVATNAATKNVKPNVNRGLVNKPIDPVTATIAPAAIKPGTGPVKTLTTANGTAIHTPGGTMKDHARKMADDAHDYDAPGILAIIDYMDENLHDSLKLVAEAFDALSRKAHDKWPFDQAIAQKLSMTSECLWTASSMARDIVPDIEAIHSEELKKLRNPDRPGMEKFDLAANGKA